MKALISSAKPFLSFFICVVICIDHFSHSLSVPHALHKRMLDGSEIVTTAINGGKSISESAEPTINGAGKFAQDSLKPVSPSDTHINPELVGTIGGRQTMDRPSWRSIQKLWRNWIFETLKRKFSGIIQKIKDFVGSGQVSKLSERATLRLPPSLRKDYAKLYKLVQKSESRFQKEEISENLLLLHPGLRKEYEGLSKLGDEDESLIRGKIDAFIEDIQKNHPNSQSSDLVFDEQKVAKLRKSVYSLRDIYLEDKEALELSDKSTPEILKIIPQFLGREVDGADALQIYGKRMSIYLSHFLDQDKKTLQEWLPEHQRYLSESYAILGPGGVLKPWLRKLIRQDNQFKELKFSGKEEDFLEELESIQFSLADLASLDHDTGLGKNELIERILKSIDNLEKKLINILGGDPDKLKEALKMITKRDFHKEIMEEMKTPRSLTGYKMLFLSPFGHLRQSYTKFNPLYKELGLPIRVEGFQQLDFDKYMNLLSNDVEETLDVYLRRETAEKNLMEILKPEGLQRLGDYLGKSEKVSPLE